LVIDAANVIGSRPTGWWRDRPGAARTFVDQVRAAVGEGRLTAPVVVVLEGQARQGVDTGETDGVTIVHAAASGDDAMVEVIGAASGSVTLVTADRGLRQRAEDLGAEIVGPRWLSDRLVPRSGP
jgi:hypothetical protein